MQSLPIFIRLTNRPVILLGDGEAAAAKRMILDRAGANIVGEEGAARIAIVALEDDEEAESAVARLRARNILVNAVDRPGLCDFTLPAIVDRDPVLVAIGTCGASAGLAKALRQRFEQLLPARLGAIACRLRDKRAEIRAKWPAAKDRRRAIDTALDEGNLLDPLTPLVPRAVDDWINGDESDSPVRQDQFEIIQLRSADPHDLTIGETMLLGRADRLYLAPGVPQAIINRARADAKRIDATEPPEYPGTGLSIYVTVKPIG